MLKSRIVPKRPALILENEKKYLIITDIHIGFESSITANDIFLGKNSTINDTILDMQELINLERPDSVILLGDVKSSIKNISKAEWQEVPMFFEKIREMCDVILIPGNHDANIQRLIPESITLISSLGMIENDVLLTHGHTMPSENFSHVNKIIMGHIHPVFLDETSIVNGQRVWISMKTKKEDIFPDKTGELEITIIPSFNRYFYATNRQKYKRSISPIIERIKHVSSAKVITLDGTIIGDESLLSKVI